MKNLIKITLSSGDIQLSQTCSSGNFEDTVNAMYNYLAGNKPSVRRLSKINTIRTAVLHAIKCKPGMGWRGIEANVENLLGYKMKRSSVSATLSTAIKNNEIAYIDSTGGRMYFPI